MFFYEYPTLSYHLKAVFYVIWCFLLCFLEIPFTIDCIISYTRHTIRYCYARQAAAARECTFSRRRFTSLPLDMYNIYPLIHRIVTTQVSITSPTANNNIATLIGTLLFDFSSFLPISSDQTSL